MTGGGIFLLRAGVLTLTTGMALSIFPQQLVPLLVPELNGAHIQCFAEDPQGALWIGTDRGLMRFDGSAVEQYVSDPADPQALPNDAVYDLLADPNGMLHVATASGAWSVNTVTGNHRRMRSVRNGENTDLEYLHLASSKQGHWAFCGGAGIFRLLPGDSLYRAIEPPKPCTRVSGGWEAADGSLWFVDRMDLRHWDPQTGEEEVFRLDPYGEIAPAKTLLLNLWPDRHDTERLWISSWGIGLIAFDLKTHRFTPYTVAHPLSDLENVVTAAVQTAPDLWYLAMDGQLWTLRPSDATAPLERVHPPAEAFGLGSIHEGTLCIGGTGQVGILPKPIAGANAIEGELARANLCAIGDGTGVGYWAVRYYADRVLMHTDAKGHVDLTIPLPIEDRPYEPFHLMHGTDGNIWIGTTRGLMRYTPGSSAVERIPLQGQGWDASFANVLDLTEDDTGVLWIASGNGTVIQLDERTGSCRSITLAPALGNAPPLALCRLDTAHMLIIRRNASPVVVHCRKPTMERFAGPKIPDPTFTDAVGAVVQRDGRVIVYYRSHGLRRFERSSDGTWIEDHRWYLPMRPSFNDAVRDGAGRIFFTADRGAHMLDPATDALHALDAAHGVNARSDANAARLSNGDVLLGGAPHVRFSSDFQPLGPRTPFLVRSFQAAGIDHTSQVLSDRPLELAHDRNNISIAFGRIALLDGDVFTYSYRTVRDGKEEPWNDLGRQRSVNLVGLGPGAYRVELGSAGLTAGPAIVSVSFTVLPAWWNTWWMRTSIILALIASVVVITRHVLALRYRRRMRELERQRELERVRMRISRDVHDGIGSGLTKVTMMLRNLKGTDVEQAQRIAQASRELVQELGEIVWTVDPRNDDVASFIAYVRNTLGRQFDDLDVKLEARLNHAPEMAGRMIAPDLKRNVLLVMREALNNALKHSGADRIIVDLNIRPEELALRVQDNGKGFEVGRTREGGNGLQNFQRRAEEVHGTCSTTSGATGTVVEFTAPISSTKMGARPT